MGNVLKMAKRQQIESLYSLGYSQRKIHRVTGIHRRTIKRYITALQEKTSSEEIAPAKNQSVPEVPTDLWEPPPPTQSKLIAPFAVVIQQKHQQGLHAQRIYQDLVDESHFIGSYDSVKRYVRKLKESTPKYYQRLSHLPGEEAQVDFGLACPVRKGDRYRRCWLFKMTLSFSGHSYEELVWSQDTETFIRCHERAFRFFGGVPHTVKLDNLKAGVITANKYDPELNPVYLEFAKHWNFAANPCAPYRPEHKGTVEKDVCYTKENALKGRQFESLAEGNRHLREWNRKWARTRTHGGHKQQVWKLFCDVERPQLRPLAEKDFGFFEIGERKVDVHGHVEVYTSFYSVPHQYIGRKLRVHYNSSYVKVFSPEDALLCTHRTLPGKAKRSTKRIHLPEYNKPREQHELYLVNRAGKVGEACAKLAEKVLLNNTDPIALRRARGIIYLDKKFPPFVLEEACKTALNTGSLRVSNVKALCEKLHEKTQTQTTELTQEHDLIRDPSHYILN